MTIQTSARTGPGPTSQKASSTPQVRPHAAIYLLGVLGALLVLAPFLDNLAGGDLIEAVLLSGVMLCSVLALGARRKTLTVALVLAGPALAGKWFNHFAPGTTSGLIYLIATMIFFGFVITHLVGFVLRAPRVDANVLCAGLSGYLLLGLLWIPAYILLNRLDPASFNLPSGSPPGSGLDRFSAFYFSFITLCTVGYGDLTPASKVARMLAITEAIAGLFYVAVLISRLVALYSTPQSSNSQDERGRVASEPE